jgi:hypothetical protein
MFSPRISLLAAILSVTFLPSWSGAETMTDALKFVRTAARQKDTRGVVARFPRLNYLYALKAPPGSPRITPAMIQSLKAAKDRFFSFAQGLLGSMEDFRSVESIRCPIKASRPGTENALELALVQVRHPWSGFLAAWKAMSRDKGPQALKRLERGLTASGDLVKVGPRRYVYSLLVLIRVSPPARALFKRQFDWKNPGLENGAWVVDRFDQRSSGQANWKRIKTRLKCRPGGRPAPGR